MSPHSCASVTWSYAAIQAHSSICPGPADMRNANKDSRMPARSRQAGSPTDGNCSSTCRRTHGLALVGSNSVDTA